MKNKRIQFVMIITIVLLLLCSINSWASTLTLKTITNKENYTIGEKVIVTIDWTEKMQAASFTLKYDAEKLQFESANIANTFYNKETAGEIQINWASMEEVDYTKMVFNFKAIKEGEASISVDNPNSFANGNLVGPNEYNVISGTKNIIIKNNNKVEEEKKDNNTLNTTNFNKDNNTIKKDNTTAKGKMPQTGKETTIVCFMVGLLIFGIVGLVKYKKFSDI